MEEGLGGSLVRDDPICIMKLKVLEIVLYCLPVQVCLCVLARPQAEEEGDLDEVGLALGKREGYVGRLRRGNVKAMPRPSGMIFSRLCGGSLYNM